VRISLPGAGQRDSSSTAALTTIIYLYNFRICSNRSRCIVCLDDGVFNYVYLKIIHYVKISLEYSVTRITRLFWVQKIVGSSPAILRS
jgi:hypothetical protein